VLTGTSVNEISYRSGGTGCSGMPAKVRQLGWMCVAPTPLAHACADGGRSDRRAVAPMNTIRTVAVVEPDGVVGDDSRSTHRSPALRDQTLSQRSVRTCEQHTDNSSAHRVAVTSSRPRVCQLHVPARTVDVPGRLRAAALSSRSAPGQLEWRCSVGSWDLRP
jgi:hypothetical protein